MKPYNIENKSKGEEVRDMFDRIAPKYDLLNHTLSAGIDKLWRRRVVRIVQRFKPLRVMDMSTGTGDLAIAMAKRMPTAKVVGIDPSEGMLKVAQEKVSNLGLTEQIELHVGSAEELNGWQGGLFDVQTVAFGVRNFDNIELGLEQMHSLLRQGGHLVVLEFSTPTMPIFSWLYRCYSHYILPRIGGLISKERKAYEYLPASVDEFFRPKRFCELLTKLGFTEVRSRSLSGGIAQIYTARKGL